MPTPKKTTPKKTAAKKSAACINNETAQSNKAAYQAQQVRIDELDCANKAGFLRGLEKGRKDAASDQAEENESNPFYQIGETKAKIRDIEAEIFAFEKTLVELKQERKILYAKLEAYRIMTAGYL